MGHYYDGTPYATKLLALCLKNVPWNNPENDLKNDLQNPENVKCNPLLALCLRMFPRMVHLQNNFENDPEGTIQVLGFLW